VAYALSPIDLIPDFIPVLGYLDDLIIIPLGLALVIKMVPAPVMADCRVQARAATGTGAPKNWGVVIIIVCIWLAFAALIGTWLLRTFKLPSN